MITHASLFSGIGGFDLAAEWAGWENVFHCEINEFARKILKYYWPNADSFTDIKQTDFKKYANRIDILSGGFPCQPFSTAGKRIGVNDERFLWPEMRRVYNELQPAWVVCENVVGLLSMEDTREVSKDVYAKMEDRKVVRLQEVDNYEALYVRQTKMLVESIFEDLEADGYEIFPIIIPAASIQAPHKRERLWIVAYSNRVHGDISGFRASQVSQFEASGIFENIAPDANDDGCNGAKVGQSYRERDDGIKAGAKTIEQPQRRGSKADATNSAGKRLRRKSDRERKSRIAGKIDEIPDWEKFPTQSPICGGDDGLSVELDGITFSKWRRESVRAYGNAVVPQVVYEIFKVIDKLIKSEKKET